MTKRDTIIELLKHYREAQETLGSAGDNGSGEGQPWRMPKAWNQSYRELERCLHVISGERPKQHRQLMARYVDPTICRRRLIGRRKGDGSVLFVNMPYHAEVRSYAKLPDKDRLANEWDVVLATWPAWVKEQLVGHAVDALVKHFVGDAYLPQEMFDHETTKIAA